MSFTVIRDDGTAYAFDVLDESHEAELDATEHPVEGGAAVTDHIRRKPRGLSARVLVTESPRAPAGSAVTVGVERLLEALDFLRSCEGRLLSVVSSRLGTLDSCVLVRYPHEVATVRNLPISLGFKAIRIAESGIVEFPRIEAAKPNRQTGEHPTKQIDEANAAALAARTADASTLYNLLGLGG